MSLVIFDRRHLVLPARALTAAVGGSFHTVRNEHYSDSSDPGSRKSAAA